ncbi:FLZ-type domain-containing protein [Plasmodiophora brassicae]|uniref:Uncharacterized protein n=1 Tax=Plasmodiophora brassicae TaxID=37360 RepID=A0A0G4IPQ7_PLABS|nr:hypothetical protein PBRA_000557 [Plasmodiophora brassicae]SPQ97526.1 unnamed protein product [Plasmodiophora brassicae]
MMDGRRRGRPVRKPSEQLRADLLDMEHRLAFLRTKRDEARVDFEARKARNRGLIWENSRPTSIRRLAAEILQQAKTVAKPKRSGRSGAKLTTIQAPGAAPVAKRDASATCPAMATTTALAGTADEDEGHRSFQEARREWMQSSARRASMTTDPGTGALVGAFDEDESHRSFQEARNEWLRSSGRRPAPEADSGFAGDDDDAFEIVATQVAMVRASCYHCYALRHADQMHVDTLISKGFCNAACADAYHEVNRVPCAGATCRKAMYRRDAYLAEGIAFCSASCAGPAP